MSNQFVAYINEQEYGPVSYDILDSLWRDGKIEKGTPVRRADQTEWSTFDGVRASHLQAQAEKARAATRAPQSVASMILPCMGLIPGTRAATRAPQSVAGVASYVAKEYSPGMPGVREKLRELTGYPALRMGLVILLFVSILGLLGSVFVMFDADSRLLGIAGAISCLGSIFSILILGVLLDIADALLAKLD
jgi:hypothetical protein